MRVGHTTRVHLHQTAWCVVVHKKNMRDVLCRRTLSSLVERSVVARPWCRPARSLSLSSVVYL